MDLLIGQTPETHPGQAGGDAAVVEGDQKTFMADVVEASKKIPVLVDFWATWCGPCKQLGPTLEKVVRSAQGRVKLVKIDIDKNQALVQQLATLGLPLQSVPTVAAFWQGQVADLFQGAVPESEVKRFVDDVLRLAGSKVLGSEVLPKAKAALAEGNAAEAERLFTRAVQEEAENVEAWAGLVRAALAAGHEAAAKKALARVPPTLADHAEIKAVQAALTLSEEGRKAAGGIAALEERLVRNAADHTARFELASALNALNRREEAADALIEIMRRDRTWHDDGARLQLLKFFEAWGFDDPASVSGRRKLSSLLFR